MPLPVIPAIGRTPYGNFGATQTSVSSIPYGTIERGLDYRNPANRVFSMEASVDMFNLPSLPDRLQKYLTEALIWHVREVAEAVIDTAQASLVPGHGYRTGLLRNSLVARFAEHLLATGVYYDLLSEVAYYWRWVEFGHWMTNGQFWQGYHYLENAIVLHQSTLRRAVREAWADTARKLASEARAAGAP